MKIKTLCGREISFEIVPRKYPARSKEESKSYGQYNLGQCLKNIYGDITMLEEFGIPQSRLSLDFYLPNHSVAFEFQGIQHDKFNQFFHVDKKGFEQQIVRDGEKKRWCKMNDVTLIEVRDKNITPEQLKRDIVNG